MKYCILQGWCLILKNDVWTSCFITVDNGLLLWYHDEKKLKPIGIAKILNEVIVTDNYLKQFNNERVITIKVDEINLTNSVIELGIIEDELTCWLNVLRLDNSDNKIINLNELYNSIYNNNDSDNEYSDIVNLKETVEIQLKDDVIAIDIHIDTNVIELVNKISEQYFLKEEAKVFLQSEFLKSQVELFRKHEINLKKQISHMSKRLNDISLYEQRAALAEKHVEMLSYSLHSIETLLNDIGDINDSDDNKVMDNTFDTGGITNKSLQIIKDLRCERALLIKKINGMKDETRRMTYQLRNGKESSNNDSFAIEINKLRFELINSEDKYAKLKIRYDDAIEKLEATNANLRHCEERLSKVTVHLEKEQKTDHAKLIESISHENNVLKSQVLTMRGEINRLQSESEDLQTSAIDTVTALKELIPLEIATVNVEIISPNKTSYDIDLFDDSNKNKSKKSIVNETSNFFVKSSESVSKILEFKITSIIEERLFSNIYEKYISDSSGLLTLQRMHRYVKEFNIVGNQPGFLVLGEIDVIFKNVLKILPDGEEVVLSKARPYGVRAGMNESVYKKEMPHLAVKTPEKFNLKNVYESKLVGAQSITRGQFIVANQHIACQIYSGLVVKQLGAALDCLPPKQQKIAVRAVMDTFLKKKLLPVVYSLNMIPWSLIHLDRTFEILCSNKSIAELLINRSQLLHSWYCHYSLYENHSLEQERMPYKSLSKFAHNFAIVPYLLKEPQLHNIFKEMSIWYQLEPSILSRSLPKEILDMPTTTNLSNKIKENSNNRNDLETICFGSFVCIISCIAIQAFPDYDCYTSIDKLMSWLSQSGGSYILSKEKVSMTTKKD